MKKIIYLCYLPLIFLYAGCKKDPINIDSHSKQGVSLPTVTNLKLEKLKDGGVEVTWDNPASIPDEIQQPLSIYLEVNQIVGVTKAVNEFSTTLNSAPDINKVLQVPIKYTYTLKDPTKTYHITVKVVGNTKIVDKNYSSVIYSLGQTVIYNQ